jgi:hypothetical protein
MGPLLGGSARASFSPTKAAAVFDGNSLVDTATSDLVLQLQAIAPISNQITILNRGVSGQTIRNMITRAPSNVDNAFIDGKSNYLFLFEITNSIFNSGLTGMQAIADLNEYIQGRLALHPWKIILLTCLPRGDFLGTTWDAYTGEDQIQIANTYLRQNFRAMGAKALVEIRRAGGPFDFNDPWNHGRFPPSLWNDLTHPNAAGRAIEAQYIADVLKRLPAR